MTSDLEKAVESAVAETMENWVFAETLRVSNDDSAPANFLPESARISFGAFGEMELLLESSFLVGVAKALFSPDEGDPSAERKKDVFLELLNLIAGRAVAFLNEQGHAVEMSLPKLYARAGSGKERVQWTFCSESLGKMVVVFYTL